MFRRSLRWVLAGAVGAELALLAAFPASGAPRLGITTTALDRYVAEPDAAYQWEAAASSRNEGATVHAIRMTSQEWLTPELVNRTRWKHWLLIVKPDNLAHDTALLFISGGNNTGNKPPTPGAELIRIAKETRSVVAELRMVPNQPLIFGNDARKRVEDDIIAYTWDRFLRTGDEKWPARLPMTKAGVRAMDTITAFLGSEPGGKVKVDKFVISGASKRGWTAWTTAAVDDRVVAIAPVVIDLLNTEESMRHHFQAYGFYAPAVGSYTGQKIMDWIGTPESKALYAIEDPFSYRDRLTMPKLIMNSCGDQFFLPDSSRFYFDQLVGPSYLRYVPNTDHSMRGSDAYETLLAWQYLIANNLPLPRLTWKYSAGGSLTVTAADKPKQVLFWQAHNDSARDFRLESVGPVYQSTPVAPDADGNYTAVARESGRGWTAGFMELTFDVGAPTPLKLTTDVRITPDTLPFPVPNPEPPKGFLSR